MWGVWETVYWAAVVGLFAIAGVGAVYFAPLRSSAENLRATLEARFKRSGRGRPNTPRKILREKNWETQRKAIERYQERARALLDELRGVRALLIARLGVTFLLQVFVCVGVSSLALLLALEGIGEPTRLDGKTLEQAIAASRTFDPSNVNFVLSQIANSATFDASKLVIGETKADSQIAGVFAYLHRLILGFALPSFVIFAFVRAPMVLLTPISAFEAQLAWEAGATPEEIRDRWKAQKRFGLSSMLGLGRDFSSSPRRRSAG